MLTMMPQNICWIVLQLYLTSFVGCTARNQLYRVDSDSSMCICAQHVLMFNCTTVGSGYTIWYVNNCPQDGITLRHSGYNVEDGVRDERMCGLFLVEAFGNVTNGNKFTSYLLVSLLNGNLSDTNTDVSIDVRCAHSDGMSESIPNNITLELTFITGVLQMPMDIVVLESSGVLNITWDHVFENCPLYRYHIQATDSCGDCPPFTRDAMVFCTDVADISMCFINISVEVCGMSGPVGTGEVSTSFISSPTSSTPSNVLAAVLSTILLIASVSVITAVVLCLWCLKKIKFNFNLMMNALMKCFQGLLSCTQGPQTQNNQYDIELKEHDRKEEDDGSGSFERNETTDDHGITIQQPDLPVRNRGETSEPAAVPQRYSANLEPVSTPLTCLPKLLLHEGGQTSQETEIPSHEGSINSEAEASPLLSPSFERLKETIKRELRDEVKTDVKSLEVKVENLEELLTTINKELAYVKTSLLSTLDKLKKVENEKDNLESKLSDSKKEVRRLTKEKEDLQKIIHHLYRRLCVFTDELNKMCKQAEVGSKDQFDGKKLQKAKELRDEITNVTRSIPQDLINTSSIFVDSNREIRQSHRVIANGQDCNPSFVASASQILQGPDSKNESNEGSKSASGEGSESASGDGSESDCNESDNLLRK